MEGGPYKYPHEKYMPKDGKVLARLGFQIKDISQVFNWIKYAWVGFCTSSPTAECVKYQLC